MFALLSKLLFSFIFSFLITFYIIPSLCKVAARLGIVDVPDGKIKRHEKTTPYLGGLAVYIGFIAALAFVHPIEKQTLFLLLGSTLLLLVGLIDDVLVIQPHQKLFGQLLASFCFLKGGFFLKEQFFHDFFIVSMLISILWILTIVNAINLVDVMDGLATTIALGSGISFFIMAWLLGSYAVCLLLSSFLGAAAAFLWYNWPQAQIYLGDTGSLFIGGFLSSIPFLLHWGTYNQYGYVIPILILAIPLLEILTLILIRTYKGIPFYRASPDHFSIYLRNRGWSKQIILLYVCGVNLILLMLSVAFVLNQISFLVLSSIAASMLFLWFFLLFF